MGMQEINDYPELSEITLGHRAVLHPLFRSLKDGISEFTFANIYLFRKTHGYGITRLKDGLLLITGADAGVRFFMSPFGTPERPVIERLFERFSFMKCASSAQTETLSLMGFKIEEDRDNDDYLYFRDELSEFSGRKFHAKKNLVNYFTSAYECEGRPLINELASDAQKVLEEWRIGKGGLSPLAGQAPLEGGTDYEAAKEALLFMEGLQLCGGVYYVKGRPVAFALGEELKEDTFVLHFAKAVSGHKGLAQFVVKSFSTLLPKKYTYINMEQDMGEEGLRKSKESYRPYGFIKKFRVMPAKG